MHPSLLLGAGLLLGQTPVITEVQVLPGTYKGPFPAAVRQVAGQPTSGWQVIDGADWTWGGEVRQVGWVQDRLGKIGDRIGSLFGRKENAPEPAPAPPMPADVRWHPLVGPQRSPAGTSGQPSGSPKVPRQFPPRISSPSLEEPPPLTVEVAPMETGPGSSASQAPALGVPTGTSPVPAAPPAAAARRIPLTPDGSFTIEVVQPERKVPAAVKPVRFQAVQPQPQQAAVPPAAPQKMLGHAEDFSWIDGRLQIENGRLMIRFASTESPPRFGGLLPLGFTGTLEVGIGEPVRVRGELVQTSGEPIYMATEFSPIPGGN